MNHRELPGWSFDRLERWQRVELQRAERTSPRVALTLTPVLHDVPTVRDEFSSIALADQERFTIRDAPTKDR